VITIYGIWYIRYADSEAALVNFCCNTSLTTEIVRFLPEEEETFCV